MKPKLNPVAKYMRQFNKATVQPNKKKDYCRKVKHKLSEEQS